MQGTSNDPEQARWKALRQKGTVYNPNGQAIRYWLCGDNGPVLFLCNALWSGAEGWSPLVKHFQDSHRLLLWEYPGHGISSGKASTGVPSVESFAADALHLLEGVGIDDAVLVGQGLGVQIVLELYRLCPERVRSIIALCGSEEGLLSGWIPGPLEEMVSRAVQKVVLPVGVPFWKLVRAFWQAYQPLHEEGRAGSDHPDPSVEERSQILLEKIHRTDPMVGLPILSSMLFYHPARLLSGINIPVLILGGDQDRLVPADRYREMARKIPGSRMVLLPGCTHRAMEEDPESVCRHAGTFLHDQGIV